MPSPTQLDEEGNRCMHLGVIGNENSNDKDDRINGTCWVSIPRSLDNRVTHANNQDGSNQKLAELTSLLIKLIEPTYTYPWPI